MKKLQDLIIKCAEQHVNQVCVVFDPGPKAGEEIQLNMGCQNTSYADDFCKYKHYTYSTLIGKSLEFKQALEEVQINGQIVAVCLTESLEVPSLLLGLLSCNCAFYPIHCDGIEYTLQALNNVGASSIVAHTCLKKDLILLLKKLNGVQVQCDVLEKHGLQLYRLKTPGQFINSIETDLAYCITTSGTTSSPKIVRVPHSCIVPNIINIREIFQLGPGDRMLLTSPLTFDPSVIDIFCTLSSGACLVVVPKALKQQPERFLNVVHHRQAVTVIQATPALLRTLTPLRLQNTILGPESHLRILALGGEPFPSGSDLRAWRHRDNTLTQFYNLYGITEISCWASCQHVDLSGVLQQDEEVPIGKALDKTVLKLMSEDGDLQVTADSEGVIWIGSSERVCLIDDEVGTNSKCQIRRDANGLVWRNSRDCGKLDSKGNIFCLGRQDDQVKRHGKRLSLLAIELVCKKMPGVTDCCVLWDGTRLIAVINMDTVIEYEHQIEVELTIEQQNKPLDPDQDLANQHIETSLHQLITETLPAHYMPDFFVMLNQSFPMTSHGKLDKKELLKIADHKIKSLFSSTKQNPLKIAQDLWMSLLPKVTSIKSSDNFIHLGGDSLAAIRGINLLEANYNCSMNKLFDILVNRDFKSFIEELSEILNCPNFNTPGKEEVSQNLAGHGVNSLVGSKRHAASDDVLVRKICKSSETAPVVSSLYDIHTVLSSEAELLPNVVSSARVRLPRVISSENVPLSNVISSENVPLSNVLSSETQPLPHVISLAAVAQPNSLLVCDSTDSSVKSIISNKEKDVGSFKNVQNKTEQAKTSASVKAISRGNRIVHCDPNSIGETCQDNQQPVNCVCPSSGQEPCPHVLNDLALCWRVDTGKCVDASPLVVLYLQTDLHLAFIGSHSGQFTAVDVNTGSSLWSVSLPDRIESSACIDITGSKVVVGCYDGNIYTLVARTGDIIWTFATGDLIKCSPVVNHATGHILCGSHDGYIYCLDICRKVCVWRCHLGGGSVFASPLVDVPYSLVYTATLSGRVAALEMNTGSVKWETELKKPIFSSLCVCEHQLLAGCVDGQLYCLDSSGNTIWTFLTQGPIFSSPVVYGSSIYFGSHDHHVYCLAVSGELRWKFKASATVYASPFPCRLYVRCGCPSEHFIRNSCFKHTMERTDQPLDTTHTNQSYYTRKTDQLHDTTQTDQSHNTTQNDKQHGLPQTDQSHNTTPSDQSHDAPNNDPLHKPPTDSLHYKLPSEVASVSAHSPILKTIPLNSAESPALCDTPSHLCDALVVPSTDGWLHILDGATGHCLTRCKLPGEVFSSPVVLNNRIIVGCRDNFLYCFDVT